MNTEVKSAARILEILELLARASQPVRLTDIAQELGFPKSSTFNLLSTLVLRGYAIRDEEERYELNESCRTGPGWTGGRDAQLIAIAHPVMKQLRDACGETVLLGVRMRDGRLRTIAKSVANLQTRFDSELEGGLPSYCSAMGRVLLAFWEPKLVERYLARERLVSHTAATVVDRVKLKHIIQEVRHDGFAISDQEMDICGSGVAAPIFDAEGTVVAALNVATIAQRFASKRVRLIELTKSHALLISRRNGYVPVRGTGSWDASAIPTISPL